MKKIVALIIVLVLMFAFSSVALASSAGNQVYQRSSITHRYDFGPLAKDTANWTSATDKNTYVQFGNSSLERYQNSCVVTDTGTAMGTQKSVYSGKSASLPLYQSYLSTAHANLRASNPYYGTANASPMSTSGVFTMTF